MNVDATGTAAPIPECGAFSSEKELWKRQGNFYTAEELRKMDDAEDVEVHLINEPEMSAD